ncbi:sigma 54-interacting transcriptional regulator, partial [Acinetobacter soli]
MVIFGEPGTAKMQIAQMIYTKSPLSSYPMVTINCGKLVPSGWNYLMEND